jgi:outer membrane immunogenic protein
MKVSVLGGVVVALFTTGSAFAADLRVPPPAYEPGPYNWTGCYIGINAGGGYHTSSLLDFDFTSGGGIGAVAGGQIGCNYQIKRFVVGIEGEGDWSDVNTTLNEAETGFSDNFTSKNKYNASAALRVGYAFDRLLAYSKIGVAVGGFSWSLTENETTAPALSTTAAAAQTLAGLLLGIGFEYAITDRVSAKVEYDYMNFGDPTVSFAGSCTGAGCAVGGLPSLSETSNEVVQMVKVGLNYKFY